MAGGADALARSKQIYKGSEIREPGSGVPTSRGAYRNCFGDSRRRLVLGIATIVAGGNNKGNSGPNQTSNGVFESIIDTSTPTKVGYSRLNVVRCYPIESGDHVRNPGPIIPATNVPWPLQSLKFPPVTSTSLIMRLTPHEFRNSW